MLPMHLNRGKLLKCHLKGKTCRKLANGHNINYSGKHIWPQGFNCPFTGAICQHIQTFLLVYLAGERLQDHWVSCFNKSRHSFVSSQ